MQQSTILLRNNVGAYCVLFVMAIACSVTYIVAHNDKYDEYIKNKVAVHRALDDKKLMLACEQRIMVNTLLVKDYHDNIVRHKGLRERLFARCHNNTQFLLFEPRIIV